MVSNAIKDISYIVVRSFFHQRYTYICIYIYKWLVVSNMFCFHPYLGKIPNLTWLKWMQVARCCQLKTRSHGALSLHVFVEYRFLRRWRGCACVPISADRTSCQRSDGNAWKAEWVCGDCEWHLCISTVRPGVVKTDARSCGALWPRWLVCIWVHGTLGKWMCRQPAQAQRAELYIHVPGSVFSL